MNAFPGRKLNRSLPALCLAAALVVCVLFGSFTGGSCSARASRAACASPFKAAYTRGISINPGLYDIAPLLPHGGEGLIYAGFEKSGLVRLLIYEDDIKRALIADLDLDTGMLCERLSVEGIELDDPMHSLRVFCADPLSIYDPEHRCLVLFNSELTDFRRFELDDHSCEDFYMTEGGVVFFDSAYMRLYMIGSDYEARPVYRQDHRYADIALTSCTLDGRFALFRGTDNYTGERSSFAVDALSGGAVSREYGLTFVSLLGTNAFRIADESGSSSLTVSSAEGVDMPAIRRTGFVLKGEAQNTSPSPGSLLFTQNTEEGLLLCRASGYGLCSVALPGDISAEDAAFALTESRGHVLAHILEGGAGRLMLWDPSGCEEDAGEEQSCEGGLLMLGAYEPADMGDLSKRAAALYEKYGVTVLIGPDAKLFLSPYTAAPCNEEAKISSALSSLEQVLALYPPEFFERICERCYSSLTVELCGPIRSGSDDAPDHPAALTGSCGDGKLIMIDLIGCGSVEGTFCHEMCHIIDSRLNQLSKGDRSMWNKESWALLNPAGFEYYDSYMDELGRPLSQTAPYDNTAENGYSGGYDDIYFANRYSKTFATEDRAVLFEALILHGERAAYLKSPHVRAKLEYFFGAIRYYLDPQNSWSEKTFWEAALEAING